MKIKRNIGIVLALLVCGLVALGLSPRTQEVIKALWIFEQGVTVEKQLDVNGYMTQKVYTPTWVDGTGFTVTGTEGNVYLIDMTDRGGAPAATIGPTSGVTVHLPTPTAVLDGLRITLFKTDSGTTPFFVYSGGLPIVHASGVTDGVLSDAQGDSITLVAKFESGVSWFLENYINR